MSKLEVCQMQNKTIIIASIRIFQLMPLLSILCASLYTFYFLKGIDNEPHFKDEQMRALAIFCTPTQRVNMLVEQHRNMQAIFDGAISGSKFYFRMSGCFLLLFLVEGGVKVYYWSRSNNIFGLSPRSIN